MKIVQQNDASIALAQTSQSSVAKASQDAAAAATAATQKSELNEPGVGVTVSSLARTLAQTGFEAPEVDSQKVETMREAIAQKTFVVNPEAIADKLLANAREMLARSR